MIQVSQGIAIDERELDERFVRAPGPGGQHVNKVATRITVTFDVLATPSLTAEQRARIVDRLGTRIDARGRIRVSCGRHRSQARNREEVVARLSALLARTLAVEAPRVATKVPAASKRKRLGDKRHRSEIKRGRSGTED